MNCEEFKAMKDRYLQGNITPAEERDMENHLENCADCRAIVDQEMAAGEPEVPTGLLSAGNTSYRIDEKKQQRILRRAKYKNRFSLALFMFALFIVLSFAGTLLSSIYFNYGGAEGRLYKTQKTAALLTEFTFPNVTVPAYSQPFPLLLSGAGWGDSSSVKVEPYFAVRGSYAMQKRVGREDYPVGHININQFFSSLNVKWQWQGERFDDYLYFVYPEQQDDGNTGETKTNLNNEAEPTWQALEMLAAGTVAEMSVSFDRTYTVDQVKSLLSDYDLDITWYAISTGQEANPHYPEDRHGPQSAFQGVWGFPDLSQNMLSEYSPIDSDDGAIREKYVLESMQFLAENKWTARKIYRGEPETLQIPARYKYVKENGIHVYGVVVTGPSKELLKLKDIDVINSPALGEVRLWNWFSRNFEGTMY